MKATAYYNEIDPAAAQWIRKLIEAGQIAHGIVDERSIEDVFPSDLRGFTQCHFFAGIGVWSHALRASGWADERPVWTGSCPCQPFSAAGKGAGFDDERHLWPAFQHLIKECSPAIVIGEQVASKNTQPWIDLVHTDLEALGYAFGCVPFPAAGVGASHIRDRVYWVADASGARSLPSAHAGIHSCEESAGPRHGEFERPGAIDGLADTDSEDQCGRGIQGCRQGDGAGARQSCERPTGLCADGRLGNTNLQCQRSADNGSRTRNAGWHGRDDRPGPVNGFWRDADWLFCRDGKWRPVEPGLKPLAHGMPRSMGALPPKLQRLAELAGLSAASLKSAKAYRTGSLKGYGNAINAKAAQAFVECVAETNQPVAQSNNAQAAIKNVAELETV